MIRQTPKEQAESLVTWQILASRGGSEINAKVFGVHLRILKTANESDLTLRELRRAVQRFIEQQERDLIP